MALLKKSTRTKDRIMLKTLLLLAYEFFIIGAFSFGGGMATIPFLFNLCDKYNWFTPSELVDMIALSEITPGPIGVNMATYVGIKTAGITGGIVSVLSLIAPAIIFILITYKFMFKNKSKITDRIFYGLKAVVVAMFASGLWSVAKQTLFVITPSFKINVFESVLFLIMCAVTFLYKKIHPTLLIFISGVCGAIMHFITR